ncbi:MAG TPA: 50S ribosomal protein L4 [Acidimicrobiales bacterium]|nr:50S ribosomal protein L4 [Acidimicrobiales bacterium]
MSASNTRTQASAPRRSAEADGGSYRRRIRPEPQARSVARRRPDGTVLGEVALDGDIFGIEPNKAVLHQVVIAQLAAARSGTQSTKTRAEVAGGGAKPFKQKGTGRSRQGSTRAPQWSGGGVALGPKPRSYRQRTPKKMIRLALHSALSDRAAEERVALVDAWGFDTPRTRDAAAALRALGITGKALVVLGTDDLDAAYSFRNMPDVHIIAASELNAYDVLRNDWVVFTDATLPGAAATSAAGAAPSAAGAAPSATAADDESATAADDESATDEGGEA